MPILDANTKSSIDAVVREYAFPDIHIGAGEDESPGFLSGRMFLSVIRIRCTNKQTTNVLWVKSGGMLAGIAIVGEFGYTRKAVGVIRRRTGWLARAATCRKVPSTIHTLVPDEGMKTVFWLNGSLEFFDENDGLLETLDVFWFMDHYLSYCRENGIPINKKLFV